MNAIRNSIARLLQKAQDRFVRSRAGSVLILVVALLVLMALIGTAYVSMAQYDRVAAQQHSYNTQIEMLVQGVVELAKGKLTADLFPNSQFRQGTPGSGYTHFTSLGLDAAAAASTNPPVQAGNDFQAQRHPDPPIGNTGPFWHYITAPLTGGQYESPQNATAYGRDLATTPVTPALMAPTKITINNIDYPAFQIYDANHNPVGAPVLAADADGDGIPDSGLVKLPIGTLNGVTYYYAVRILDNASAINASVAWTRNALTAVSPQGGIPGDFFPTNIDLFSLLANPNAEMTGLNTDPTSGRWGNQNLTVPPYGQGQPLVDFGGPRADFAFTTGQEAMWTQLGRRIANPLGAYRALPTSESMAMAYHFCLANPNSTPSVLEKLMPQSVYFGAGNNQYVQTTPYSPTTGVYWYNVNCGFDPMNLNSVQKFPLRTILTSRNGVTNFAPNKLILANAGPYNFGDMIVSNTGQTFVCLKAPGSGPLPPPPSLGAPPAPVDSEQWAFEPWSVKSAAPGQTGTPVMMKTSVNTGTFGELAVAYWNVMNDQVDPASHQGIPPAYCGTAAVGQRMFRSSARNPAVQLTGSQMLQLRANLAAIQTLSIRDSSDDVTSRLITLADATGKQQYDVMLYGAEKQPYITEIYARNDQAATNEYVAIELYNPYPVPINLRFWQLAALNRSASPFTLTALTGTATWTTTSAPVIPANGYIVLANLPVPPAGITIDTTKLVVGTNLFVVPGLEAEGLGKEVVLLRPRRFSGTLVNNAGDPTNPYNEAANLYDLVPVDSYDFTDLPAVAVAAPQAMEWHYIRPNATAADSTSKAWHFIFPGHWDPKPAALANGLPGPNLADGTQVTSPPAAATDLTMTLGKADTAVLSPVAEPPSFQDMPIQLSNTDFAGPHKNGGGGNGFPFGAFARNGDILQVPFIGGYRITPVGQPQTILELNSVTMDAAEATSNDVNNGAPFNQPTTVAGVPLENIGRFCPIDGKIDAGNSAGADDFGANQTLWRYRFALRLFDYLTVQDPQLDYTPDVDPVSYTAAGNPVPVPVANTAPKIYNGNADNPGTPPATDEPSAIQGLININTAPWVVLSAVPWVPPDYPNAQQVDSAIAQAIVKFRDVDDGSGANPPHGHGPFLSIFELNRILVGGIPLREALGDTGRSDFTIDQGNLSPIQGGFDNVYADFESRYLMINRVSNLLTTRSDSFTVYIIVQGWRGAGTANPQLVVQRRAAFIADRSGMTPINKQLNITNVPTD